MNDLRRDINKVFATQQAQLGDVSGARDRMLRAATAGPRVNRQIRRSVAGVAVVLVAASAIGASIVIRGIHPRSVVTHPSPTPIATPSATPAPTPMSQQLQVPATTPLILFRDPVDAQQLDGITWDGSAKGRLAVHSEAGMGFIQNPAGTLYGWTGYIRDRTGAVVAAPAVTTKGFAGTWGDDGQHYCSMVSKSTAPPFEGEPATLQVTAVGQAPRDVAQVARMYQQASAGVVACSIERDRAVVVQYIVTGTATQFWVVQLSTGRILWTRSSSDFRSSRDGQFIAETSVSPATGSSATTIYGPSGAVVGHVAGLVEAFSWDGSLAVQMAAPGGEVSVINWRSGAVVWKGGGDAGFYDALPEPNGQHIAVWLLDPQNPQTGGFPPRNLYVVGPDGQEVQLLRDVM